MKTRKSTHGYLISIDPREDIVACLYAFAKEIGVGSAVFTAIGAVSEVELGYYAIAEKQYYWKVFTGTIEIASLNGNIAWHKGEPVVHAHGVFSGVDFSTFGGHIRRALVSAACEIEIIDHGVQLVRSHNEEIGLNLWNIEA